MTGYFMASISSVRPTEDEDGNYFALSVRHGEGFGTVAASLQKFLWIKLYNNFFLKLLYGFQYSERDFETY